MTFFQHGRHLKIGIINFGCILLHSARVRKHQTSKILCFAICVEDYHKLTQTVFYPVSNLTSMLTKTSLSILLDLIIKQNGGWQDVLVQNI